MEDALVVEVIELELMKLKVRLGASIVNTYGIYKMTSPCRITG